MEHTKLVWKRGMQFDAYSVGLDEPIHIDSEEKFGGIGYGYQPKPMMLIALGGCTALDVASLMKKMKIDENVSKFTVDVDAEMTEEHPKFFNKVHVIYNFVGKEMNEKKLTKCVSLSESRYCGVFKMFRAFAEVSLEINFIEE